MGFGGNNGLTDFKDILGFDIQADGTRAGLFAASAIALALGFAACAYIVGSRTGKVLVAIRDAESRTRFCGYRVEHYKLFVWTFSAMLAGIGGALYVPQAGIINPGEFAPANSIEAVIWVAFGGRGTLVGCDRRRPRRQRHQVLADRQLPGDLALRAGCPVHRHDPVPAQGHRRSADRPVVAAARGQARGTHPGRRRGGQGMSVVTDTIHDGRAAGTILYLDGVSVSFDGFKALNELSLYLDKGEMRAIIGPNGAGKTTMMDVITGKTRPDKGTVLFREDIDLTRHDEADIARLGIGRKFQKPTVFESHTVWTNLELALKGERAAVPLAVLRPVAARSATGSTRCWASSGSRTPRAGSPASSATARSSGSRSACCWSRTPSCCWSTSPWPA